MAGLRWSLGLIVVLVLIVVGIWAWQSNNPETTTGFQAGVGGAPNVPDSRIDERARIHFLLQEHAAAGATHLAALYDGADVTDTRERLDVNTQELAIVFEKLSGEPQDEFLSVWRGHMGEYERYTLAVKQGNTIEAETARAILNMHADDFGREMSDMLPNVSGDEASNAMKEHARLTLAFVDAHSRGADVEKAGIIAQSSAQAASFAEALIE